LTDTLGQQRRDHPRDGVGRATGRARCDDTHRPVGIATLRVYKRLETRQYGDCR
jgi:hypothetical protein